ncbi:MAG: ABC transporter ATP-binding protein [Bacteriovoracaceae bacterium]
MILEVKNIKKNYQQAQRAIQVLKDVSFKLDDGKSLAILGKSGSGKSTLLAILSGLVGPDSGDISFLGESLSKKNEDDLTQLRASKIGIIFQQYHLLAHLTALENVTLSLEINKIANPIQKAMKVLEQVGLKDRSEHFPYQLSGGEQQRVAIARSLVMNPELILADEPSGSLDSETGTHVMDILFNVTKSKGMVLVTHNKDLAHRCDHILYLEKGVLSEYSG